jgi:hypothetical protein
MSPSLLFTLFTQHNDCPFIVTDQRSYDFRKIVEKANPVIDTRNATKGIRASNVAPARTQKRPPRKFFLAVSQ